jgi:transcriptional antiterminator RfaH
MPWYVVSTKPHQEKQAELHIKQCGIECFLPLLKESKIIRRTRKTVIEPLFPGYLFARFELERHYRAVSYATGVRKIVEFGSGPVELDATMIDAIKERLNDGYVTLMPVRPVHGQVVQIKGGPLAGLQAVFMREMTDRNRVLLLLNTLGFHAKVTMDIDQLSLPQAL